MTNSSHENDFYGIHRLQRENEVRYSRPVWRGYREKVSSAKTVWISFAVALFFCNMRILHVMGSLR
jgi:hypothetical protein